MSNIFLISDTHFGHVGVTQFLRDDGTKLRPWDNIEEMDEALVSNWNSVVTPKDKVYHLGDVVINRKHLKTLSRLNGEKVLVKGNHDIFRIDEYLEHFKDVRGYHILDNLIMSHIPIHPDSRGRFRGNIHGHLHANIVGDPWYYNVSVEQINYTPIPFETVRGSIIVNQGENA
jgi:calcineurin-like phosphoesterase family protein